MSTDMLRTVRQGGPAPNLPVHIYPSKKQVGILDVVDKER